VLYAGQSEDGAATLCHTVTQHTSAVSRMRRRSYHPPHHRSTIEQPRSYAAPVAPAAENTLFTLQSVVSAA